MLERGFAFNFFGVENMEKSKSRIMVFFIVIISIFFAGNLFGEETLFYCEQEDNSKFYYDKESVVYSSGKIKLWNSVLLSDEARDYIRKNFDTDDIDPYKILTYNEIDCEQMSFRVLSILFCGENRTFMRLVDDEHRSVIPNSCPEELLNIVCKKGNHGKN